MRNGELEGIDNTLHITVQLHAIQLMERSYKVCVIPSVLSCVLWGR